MSLEEAYRVAANNKWWATNTHAALETAHRVSDVLGIAAMMGPQAKFMAPLYKVKTMAMDHVTDLTGEWAEGSKQAYAQAKAALKAVDGVFGGNEVVDTAFEMNPINATVNGAAQSIGGPSMVG